ncbi:unnamed protein product [Absidia cylindrospora]
MKEQNFTVCIIGGTESPSNVHDFLTPAYEELERLSRVGIEVETDDGVMVRSKIHQIIFSGDIPAAKQLANHRCHQSYHGCRMCLIKDTHCGGMYFPGRTVKQTIRQIEDFVNPDPQVIFFVYITPLLILFLSHIVRYYTLHSFNDIWHIFWHMLLWLG